jgi:hypothetical protein
VTHYEILGVPVYADDAEIKSAYRKRVKEFHPDRNKSEEAKEVILLINEAYDVLADQAKRARYDLSRVQVSEVVYEEDPREIYRREYIRKKNEKVRLQKIRTVRNEKLTMRLFRFMAFPILLFAFLLIIDFYLPEDRISEVVEYGWQETSGRGRYSRGSVLHSYMQTEHFSFPVDHQLHLDYPYYEPNKPPIVLRMTPLFQTIKSISTEINGRVWYSTGIGTIYSFIIPLHWIMFFSALFTVLRKAYELATYSLCFLPVLLLAFVLLIMF